MNNEVREKPYFLKRVVAYLIDIILVVMLATTISMIFQFTQTSDEKSASAEWLELVKKYNNKEITQEEYEKQSNELNYYLAKETVGTTIVICSVSLVYYVIMCYFCHGITLGKYLMKLRIVSANDKELNIGNYLIRALFADLILSYLLNIISVYALSKETFINIYLKASSVITLFLLATVLFIMYRNDGRGLHDLLANTKIISTKEKKENKEVVEAKVIEEKKIEKKTTKKNTKKEVKKK